MALIAPDTLIAQETTISAGEPCAVEPASSWNSSERWVWQKICAGEIADFNAEPGYGGYLDPASAAIWPESRIITPEFIKTILTSDRYVNAIKHHQVSIEGALFVLPLDLSHARITVPLRLQSCRFESYVDFTLASGHKLLSLENTVVEEYVEFNSFDIDGSLILNGLSTGNVSLTSANVKKHIWMREARIEGPLTLSAMQLGGAFLFNNSNAGSIRMDLGSYGGVYMPEVKVQEAIQMHWAKIQHDFQITENAEVGGMVGNDISIGGQLAIRDSRINGDIDIPNVNVSHDFLMRRADVHGYIDTRGGRIAGSFEIEGVKQIKTENSNSSGDINLSNMDVRRHLTLYKNDFNGSYLSIISSKIGENLHVSGFNLSFLDLSNSRIQGELIFGDDVPEPALWVSNSGMSLRNAEAGVIAVNTEFWPSRYDLRGFSYSRLAHPEKPLSDYVMWLSKEPNATQFSYSQLAKVLLDAGQQQTASDVLFSGQERLRARKTGWSWIGFTMLKYTIGYGYRLYYAIYWLAVFVGIGCLVIFFKSVGREKGLVWSFFYSLDTFLPIIKLDDQNYKVTVAAPAKYYFYLHILIGYVLASFLIAGLSGLTK